MAKLFDCRGSSWEVLDLQDIVVHIFTPEQREFYDLDGYYGLAEVNSPAILDHSHLSNLLLIASIIVQ